MFPLDRSLSTLYQDRCLFMVCCILLLILVTLFESAVIQDTIIVIGRNIPKVVFY